MDKTRRTTRLDKLWKRGRDLLGVEFPIMCGAMTWVSDPNLVARVSNEGAFASLACGNMPGVELERQIQSTRDLTDKLEFRIGYQHFYEPGGAPYNDDAIMLAFNWHFRKPVAAAPVAQPESVPVKKEVVDTFELQVQFDFDKSDIKSVFQPQFDEIAKVLKESPEISMTIEGHTCSIGTEKYNQGLSERRSAAVKQKFVEEFGIPAERINAEGYGESRPVADNATLAGRQKNRRAIAVILRPRMVTE